MNRISERNRPLVIAATAVIVLLLVAGGVLIFGQLGPTPTPSTSLPPSATASPSDPSAPEGATRAFFDALVAARRTDDPDLIEPFVTSRESSAYRTVEAFLLGQRESGKASITTMLEFDDISVETSGDSARLTATLLEAGYDIDLDTGEPLESPVTLDPRTLTVELRRVDGIWKVDSFETGT